MLRTSKKSIAIVMAVVFVLGMLPTLGFAATLGGTDLTEENSPIVVSENFDTWTTIGQAYGGNTYSIFTHRHGGASKTANRDQPAVNVLATATEEMAPYKAAGDTYLKFGMFGGANYTKQNGEVTESANSVSTPRIYMSSAASLKSIDETSTEKLHVSFELKNDDIHTIKQVKYCEKWNDGDTKANWFVRMYKDGTMDVGPNSDRINMPYQIGRWYKFDFVYDFATDLLTTYVDGYKVHEGDEEFTLTVNAYTTFFEFIISGDAKNLAEGVYSGMGIDNIRIALHGANDNISISPKSGLPATEMGTPVIPSYDFGTAGSYTAKIPYTLFEANQSAQIIVASYNADGSLDKVSVGTAINSNQYAVGKILTSTCNISETANKIKVFLVDSESNVNPIIPDTEVSGVQQ